MIVMTLDCRPSQALVRRGRKTVEDWSSRYGYSAAGSRRHRAQSADGLVHHEPRRANAEMHADKDNPCPFSEMGQGLRYVPYWSIPMMTGVKHSISDDSLRSQWSRREELTPISKTPTNVDSG